LAAAIENIMVTQAFAQLEEAFRAHQACVLKAAYRLTGNMVDAEDVLQSVFLRLAAGLSTQAVSPIYRATYTSRQSTPPGSNPLKRLSRGRSRGSSRRAGIQSRCFPGTGALLLEIKNWLRRELATLNPGLPRCLSSAISKGWITRNCADHEHISGRCGSYPASDSRTTKERPRGFMKGAS